MSSDEKNGVKNGGANNEMAPQEDGTKVPLTADGVEVKFSSNDASGDAKIDMGAPQVFSGLTKEELMEYANDPFWKRMRWFLFISFWLAWLAMLVAAIVIIILAPRCVPPPEVNWTQESAIMQYDQATFPDMNDQEVLKVAGQLNMTSIYIPGLISEKDFSKYDAAYVDKIETLLKGADDAQMDVLTDFVSSDVPNDNVWVASNPGFFLPSNKLDFANDDVRTKLKDILQTYIGKGVRGFFMNEKDTSNITEFMNAGLAESEGLVLDDVVDMSSILNPFTAEGYRNFLMENAIGNDVTWNYFKYNPTAAKAGGLSEDLANLVTFSLFTVPGTPILAGLDSVDDINNQTQILKYISPLREQQSMKFSNTSWTETVDNVISFARVLKGTPGFAVAVNMDETNNATVSFTTIEGVPDNGKLSAEWPISVAGMDTKADTSLKNVFLEPLSGKIIQFSPTDKE